MSNPALAIFFGLLSTVQLHIAKAMERQGIEVFDQIRERKARKKELEHIDMDNQNDLRVDDSDKVKKPLIYIIGLILNNTIPIYAVLAAMYGPPALFTGVFGAGLIALLFYSAYILKESITKIEIWGAIVLIIGTIIIGVDGMFQPAYDMSQVDVTKSIIFVLSWLAIGAVFMTYAFKKGHPLIVGLIFGLFAGGCGALDPFLKNIGQALGQEGETGLLPQTPTGIFIWIFSFLFGTFAFIFTQWGFAKKAKANVLVPAYNSTYVVLPVILQTIVLPGFIPSNVSLIGTILVVVGIIMMRAFKPDNSDIENKIDE